MKLLFCAVLLFVSCLAFAQEGWHDDHGHSTPNTDARKAIGGFGGFVLVTSDSDWQAKWETPSDTVPHFTEAKNVARGKQVYVLTFFANPKLNSAGEADVTCDIDVAKPDGAQSTHKDNAECFKGILKGDPRNTYLSVPVIGFVGDPGDPAGEWVVRVTLHDNVRHVSVPLKVAFTLLGK